MELVQRLAFWAQLVAVSTQDPPEDVVVVPLGAVEDVPGGRAGVVVVVVAGAGVAAVGQHVLVVSHV